MVKLAINKANQTIKAQIEYFGSDIHADVGKTLHFLAEAYSAAFKLIVDNDNQIAKAIFDRNTAIAVYDETLRVKNALFARDPSSGRFMLTVTEKAKEAFLDLVSQHHDRIMNDANETNKQTDSTLARSAQNPLRMWEKAGKKNVQPTESETLFQS